MVEKWNCTIRESGGTVKEQETLLNEMGNDGWELTAVIPAGRLVFFYFKKPAIVPVPLMEAKSHAEAIRGDSGGRKQG